MRRVLVIALVAVLVVCSLGVAATGWLWSQLAVSTVDRVDFVRPLAVPPLAPSHVDGQGRRVFDLDARVGQADLGLGGLTRTWGFSQPYLGSTLRATRGEQVLVNVHNSLNVETSVHWHGMHLPAQMDGGPHQPVRPGTTWSPTWTVDQPAATLWYHPHPHGETAHHVYRGLAGMFILDDAESANLALPKQYGVDDFPVIVQDRDVDDAQLVESGRFLTDIGVLGDTILVNGTAGPYLDVTTQRVRLRLLNASNARTYDFGFSDDRAFAAVASDGGLLSAPVSLQRLRLSPGERAEIIVGVRPGERPVLRSYPPDLGGGFILDRANGGADTFDILQLRAARTLQPSPAVPASLVDVPRIPASEAVTTRSISMADQRLNRRAMSMTRVDAVVTKNTAEIWEIRNRDGLPHNFHLHDVQFQILSIGGSPPPAQFAGWKDTVFAQPEQTVRVIARFTDYADPQTPYMFHCHLLAHEDGGMMGQFVVVEPGQSVVSIDGDGHGDHGG